MLNELRAGRIHLLSGLIMIAVYLAGVASAVGFFAWMRPPMHFGGPMHEGGPWGIVRGLDLTSEQQTKVRGIIERHHAEIEAAMRETFPRVRAAREQTFDEIRALLDEAQARRFDERRAALDERLPPFGPPPLPPPLP